jgi:Rhs element Vgr protein
MPVVINELQTSIPGAENSAQVTCRILVDDNELDLAIPVLKVVIEREVNRIPTATITIIDGDVSLQDFRISNKDIFTPGNKIEIQLGYQTSTETVFKGFVAAHGNRISGNGTNLIVICRDAAIKMTLARKNACFNDMTDSDIASQLIGNYPDIQPDVETTDIKHLQLLQCNLTDWDFLMHRFDLLGCFCTADDGKLVIKKPDLMQAKKFDVVYGATLIDYQANIDARTQSETVEAGSWDYSSQQLNNGSGSAPSLQPAGNIPATDLSTAMGFDKETFSFTGKWSEAELKALADARLQKRRLAAIRGSVKFQGTDKIRPNEFITVGGIGERFSGPLYVSAVKQVYENGNWICTAQFGLEPLWFAEKVNPWHPASAQGLMPTTQGLFNGVVTDLEDPEGEFRIRVKIPAIDMEGEGIWARVASLDAGNNRGTFFRPEKDDEVIIGFLGHDMRDAIVLGMLHSSAKAAPLKPSNDNHQKGYFSRSNFQLVFDDEKKSLTIASPAGKKILISDEDKVIKIEDENGNKVTIESSGITMESAGDLTLKATGKVKLEGAEVSINGSATTEIKGGMVQIN